MKQFFTSNKTNPWFWVFLILAVGTFFAMPIMSKDAGQSGDEYSHHEQSKYVYDYYASLGKDTLAITPRPKDYNQPYYGQFADNLSYFVAKTFSIDDEYLVRHCVNSLFGWLAILFSALIAYRIAGWRAAVITFILLFLSPRFLGHSFNNLKDIPFASSIVIALYYILRVIQQFPKIKISTALLLACAIGISIAVRVGGLILFPYFAFFAFLYFILRNYKKPGLLSKTSLSEFVKLLGWGIAISFVGYAIGVLLWPFAIQKPIDNVLFAYNNMSAFAIGIRQLFEGSLQWSDALPWYYTPKFILMTIPVAVIVGLILFFTLIWKDKQNYFYYFMIFFVFFFPVFWIVYTKANVYGGWRHAMFAYPPMVIAAGLGFNLAIERISQKKLFFIIPSLLLFTSCATSYMHVEIIQKKTVLDYRQQVHLIPLSSPIPDFSTLLGIITIDGYKLKDECNENVLLEEAKLKAREIGGNAIKIVKYLPNYTLGNCAQMTLYILQLSKNKEPDSNP